MKEKEEKMASRELSSEGAMMAVLQQIDEHRTEQMETTKTFMGEFNKLICENDVGEK